MNYERNDVGDVIEIDGRSGSYFSMQIQNELLISGRSCDLLFRELPFDTARSLRFRSEQFLRDSFKFNCVVGLNAEGLGRQNLTPGDIYLLVNQGLIQIVSYNGEDIYFPSYGLVDRAGIASGISQY